MITATTNNAWPYTYLPLDRSGTSIGGIGRFRNGMMVQVNAYATALTTNAVRLYGRVFSILPGFRLGGATSAAYALGKQDWVGITFNDYIRLMAKVKHVFLKEEKR